jgi:hypothetical protein
MKKMPLQFGAHQRIALMDAPDASEIATGLTAVFDSDIRERRRRDKILTPKAVAESVEFKLRHIPKLARFVASDVLVDELIEVAKQRIVSTRPRPRKSSTSSQGGSNASV